MHLLEQQLLWPIYPLQNLLLITSHLETSRNQLPLYCLQTDGEKADYLYVELQKVFA